MVYDAQFDPVDFLLMTHTYLPAYLTKYAKKLLSKSANTVTMLYCNGFTVARFCQCKIVTFTEVTSYSFVVKYYSNP